MTRRGRRFRDGSATLIGGEWFHGAGDRRVALAQLIQEFDALAADLAGMPADSGIAAALAPTLDGFAAFAQSEARSTLAPWITEWSVYEIWYERLIWARLAARAAGVSLASPEPRPLPKTIFERGEDGTGSSTDRLVVFGRDAIKIGLGVVAALGIWRALRAVKAQMAEVANEVEEALDVEFDEPAQIDEDSPMDYEDRTREDHAR